jgi:hypothetical protein
MNVLMELQCHLTPFNEMMTSVPFPTEIIPVVKTITSLNSLHSYDLVKMLSINFQSVLKFKFS